MHISCALQILLILTALELQAERVVELMKASQRGYGMWSTLWNVKTGRPAENWSHTSMGAWADSSVRGHSALVAM
jgi:hypothetical protein